jgi:hypothetical protein
VGPVDDSTDGTDGDGSESGGGGSAGPRRFGQTWTYESIVGALPGVSLSQRAAVAAQFLLFETALLALAAWYGLWEAVLPGTGAVLVAAGGSAFMLDLGRRIRRLDVLDPYDRLLFGSRIEVVLGLLSYVALLTYLFVYDRRAAPVLLDSLLGDPPPLAPTYLALLVLWDVCYRIGTGWWAAVVAFWRSFSDEFTPETARELRRIDRRTMGFATLQLVLLPFLRSHPLLAGAVLGHVLAVFAVAGASLWLLRRS